MKTQNYLLLLLLVFVLPATAQMSTNKNPTFISHSKAYDVAPLSSFSPITDLEWKQMVEEEIEKQKTKKPKVRSYPYSSTAEPKGDDAVRQKIAPFNRGANAPSLIFEGLPSAGWPTDVNGTVGNSHYLQTTNSLYSIYDKSGNKLVGPNNINSIFSSVPGGAFNDGDPIVLFDEQADRYLISEFSVSGSNDFLLVAISQTNDPTGSWYAYSFDVDDMPDYPKFGVWRDGYYIGTNKGTTSSTQEDVYVIERDKMLLGQTAQIVGFTNLDRPESDFQIASPIDNDGTFAPTGSPGLFITLNDDAWNGIKDQLWIYELEVDWNIPANSTFERVQAIDVAAFDTDFGTGRDNISQLGSSNELDAVSHVLMNRPQYRNFGSHQTVVCCHNVDVNGSDQAGIRWYELRKTNGDWELRQQGTYAPDNHSRWMGSISINDNNRIALGYSISSSSLYPGIRFAAQSPSSYSSANGTLDVAEETIYTGLYSQLVQNRWGDYTNLCLDPSNDSVFWYTNQYIGAGGERKTKVSSFKFQQASLNADFIADELNPEVNTIVQLTDLSYGSPSSWQWTFSPSTVTYVGGTSSTSENPKVQFIASGTYNITLAISGSGDNDSETKSAYIQVTPGCTVSSFPWSEGFENSGNIPVCWTQDYVSIENRDWLFGAGNGGSNPSTSHGGSYNAYLKDGSSTAGITKLISPKIDLTSLTNAQLNFWYIQDLYYSVNDELRVYYRTSSTSDWNLLAYFSEKITSWKEDSLSLPNKSSDYYIAFEGNAISGNGVCIDDVIISEGPSCPFTVNLQTNNIGSGSAELSWVEGGSATEWEIEYGPTGFTPGAGTTVTSISSNPYTLSGLNSETAYEWYVRAKCTPSSASRWTGPASFTTIEQTFALPVIENFESGLVKFDNESGNTVNWTLETTIIHAGSQSVKSSYSSSNTNILVETGLMDLSSAIQPSLSFWHICKTEVGYDFGFVEISTDGGSNYSVLPASAYQGSATGYSTNARFDESSYTAWENGTNSTPDNTWWKKETFSLDNYKSSNVKVRFKLTSDGSIERSGWYVDDITIEVPTCPPPTSAATSSITHNSAQLSWTESGSATTWDIEYGPTGFTQGAGTTVSGTTSNPYSLTGLSSSTTYDWYVRSSCGAGDYSTWVGPTSFSTTCVATTVPYLQDFESITKPNIPNCMAIENANSDNYEWVTNDDYDAQTSGTYGAKIGSNTIEISNDWLFTEGIQLTGGVEYEAGFAYRAAGGFADEKLEVKWGTSATSAGMTSNAIWQKTGFTNDSFKLASGTFTPSTTGVYYIGIHSYSDPNKYGIYVDDIYVVKTSDTATWTGATSNHWWSASNWGNDTLPSSETNVMIPAGLSNYPTLTHMGVCGNITIGSTASGDASILDNVKLMVDNQTTVQRYLSGGKWHGVSSPVDGATVNSLYFNGSPDVWLKTYNEQNSTWSYISSLSTSMPLGAGYMSWVESGSNVTVNFDGSLRANQYMYLDGWSTPPIEYTDAQHGYNLIGNPYASAMDWDLSGWDTTGIEGSVWVWSDVASNYVYRNSQGQGSLTNGIIPMGQAFFIRVKDENRQFGMPQTVRIHSNQQYYKSNSQVLGFPGVVITCEKDSMYDEIWISFDDNASDYYDNGKDVRKMFSELEVPQLFMRHSNDTVSILSVPMLYNETRIVDLDFLPGLSGNHKLILDKHAMMWDTDILLEDKKTSQVVDFKSALEYDFESDITDENNRFLLHFVNIYTGVELPEHLKLVKVYSANGTIYITNKMNYSLELKVIDMAGLYAGNFKTKDSFYKINNLYPNRFYIIHVQGPDFVRTEKVFVK